MKINHLSSKLNHQKSLNVDELEERLVSEEMGTTMMLFILGIAVLIVMCILIA